MRNKKEEYNDFYGKNLLTYFRKHFENKNLYMALDERLGYAMRSLTQTTLEFEHIYNSLQFIKSQKNAWDRFTPEQQNDIDDIAQEIENTCTELSAILNKIIPSEDE